MFLVDDAGQDSVSVGSNSLLIQDEPGHKPGDLQDVYTAERDGGADAE